MTRTRAWPEFGSRCLVDATTVRVRFQEVDSLRVAWHGHHLAWFEVGRVAFGRRYAFGYDDILRAGYVAPIVHVEVDYARPARFDQVLNVTTRLHADPGASVRFTYRIADDADTTLATGRTVQAFTTTDGELVLTRPPFYEAFLQRWDASFVSP